MKSRAILCLSISRLLGSGRLRCQTTATAVGTVTHTSGAVVPGAAIMLTQTDTGFTRTVESNGRGVYVAPSLPVGAYSVSAEKGGFKRKTLTRIILEVFDTPHQ